MTCSNCGAANSAEARFCSSCGVSLVTRVGVEERRQVTALFADLVGSTAMGERLDPEVMRSLVGRFFELASREVRLRGGTVERFSGDAVMAIFGLAVAHEDDAERAVRAALAVRERSRDVAVLAGERHGVDVQVRIGIESGEVVVGDPFAGGTMATGDALNVAARLEQRAGPGEILIGPEAATLSRQSVRTEPVGSLELSGKAAPVEAHRVVAVADELGGERGVPGLAAPLTGRDDELALLLDVARRSRAESKPILVTLLGPAGVGKSRLTRELASRVAQQGTAVLRGRCLPYGEGITYWPLAEMLRDVARITPEMDVQEALERVREVSPDEVVAHWLAFATGLSPDAPGGGRDADREIAFAFRRLFETYPVSGPLLLIFEDIHWAEPALLDLIEYLAAWIKGVAAVVLCLSRPELLDHRPAWGAGRVEAHRMLLEPLDEAESRELLASLLAIDDLPETLRERVLARAEGNPLFVEEVVRMLIDAGVVTRQDDRWVASAAAVEVAVPESVEALIRARLDTLPRPQRSVLQSASVVGRVFQHSAVAALVDDSEPIGPRLEEAVLRDLISEERGADGPAYRFRHILIRDVAYASLPKARRAELHRRVAAWLASWAGERLDEFAEIEAYHLEQAALLEVEVSGAPDEGLRQRAVARLADVARRALDRADHRVAARFAERALALSPGDGVERMQLGVLHAESLWRRGDFRAAREEGAVLADEARRIGRGDLLGRALLVQASDVWVGIGSAGIEAARPMLEEARRLLREAGDTAGELEVAHLLGYVGWWYGDLERAFEDWDAAIELARLAGRPAMEAEAYLRQSGVRRYQGRTTEARVLVQRAADIAREAGSRRTHAMVDKARAALECVVGDPAAGRDFAARAVAVLEEVDDRGELESAIAVLAGALELLDDLAGAEALYRRGTELTAAMHHAGRLPEHERQLADILLLQGRIPEAETLALQAIEHTASGDVTTVASTRASLARVRAAQGRHAEAEELARAALAEIERTDYVADQIEVLSALAEVLTYASRDAEAEEWRARAEATAVEAFGPATPIRGWIARRLAAATAAAQGQAAVDG
ncbi:MAG TPA: AAA family ATPase [Candidatus Limnocylindrales bacterium]|nr:AAA family ATPase [Candidatus Limnocylindrales bacterium]